MVAVLLEGREPTFTPLYAAHSGNQTKEVHSFTHSRNGSGCTPRMAVLGVGRRNYPLLKMLKRYFVDLAVVFNRTGHAKASGLPDQRASLALFDDFHQCLSALGGDSPEVEAIAQALDFRFGEDSSVCGVSIGSLLLAELTACTGSVESALEEMRGVLKASGRVIPLNPLSMRLPEEEGVDGVFGGLPSASGAGQRLPGLREPLDDRAIQAISEAEAIVLGPGDLHGELLPCLRVDGIAEAIASSEAIRIYVCNLTVRADPASGCRASKSVEELGAHLGSGNLDWVVLNNARLEASTLEAHQEKGEGAVIPDLVEVMKLVPGIISAPLADEGPPVRHNPEQTTKAILQAMLVGRIPRRSCMDSAPVPGVEAIRL